MDRTAVASGAYTCVRSDLVELRPCCALLGRLARQLLPRLELLAAVLNARLLKFVAESLTLKIDRVVCWTDSMVTLQWIRGSSCQWKTFVANRVAEIQSTWDPHHWRHCSGEDNPADLLTRGLPVKALAENNLRWSGPSWLTLSCLPDQWQLPSELTESVNRENTKRQKHAQRLP